MSKAVILLVIALLSCVSAIHMQALSNGTSSGQTSQATQILVNGQPYYYNGPFKLACWLPSNTY